MDAAPIRYQVRSEDPAAHLFDVTCTVTNPDPNGQRFSVPTWIPGSYLIREFARNIVSISAASGDAVTITKIDKNTWACSPCLGPLAVSYRIYAYDLSVRGAYLDSTRGFFNGTSIFLQVIGQEDRACLVDLERPPGKRHAGWRVATAMQPDAVDESGFGCYIAPDYDELVDHPVEMGQFTLLEFEAAGVAHEVAITGKHRADTARLTADLKMLCETQIGFFGGNAPMNRYVFLVTAVGEGYGGLEHRASTSLLCRRDALPVRGRERKSDGYREFLGLCSHEYFHTWNVKRIKPQAFIPYELSRETYTRQLWAFEGITSYYDDLLLLRAGLIDASEYLELLGRTLTRLQRTPGRRRQSVAESSFDAWIKFYRQDENSPNATVSYYTKGAAIALALDLLLRRDTGGRTSLDNVMQALWQRYGETGIGVPEGGVERMVEEVSGLDLKEFFANAIHGTDELPLVQLLAHFGVGLELRPAESDSDQGGKRAARDAKELAGQVTLGLRLAEAQKARITHVIPGGAAAQAGLAAGDVIVALDGLRVSRSALPALLDGRAPGEIVRVHAFRRDELIELDVSLQVVQADTCMLHLVDASPASLSLRRGWLGC